MRLSVEDSSNEAEKAEDRLPGDDELKLKRKEMLKAMTPKERAVWFFDYYKFPVLIAIVAAVVVIGSVRAALTRLPDGFYAELINSYILDADDISEAYAEYAGIDTAKENCRIDLDTVTRWDASDQASVLIVQKIAVRVAAQEIDVMIASDEIFEQYAHEGLFMRLDQVLTRDELGELSPLLVESAKQIEEGVFVEDGFYGIKVEGAEALKDSGAYSSGGAVVAILSNTTRLERAVRFIEFLYGL